MCRFLAIQARAPIQARDFLRAFAERCVGSPEYQGDGWGVSWLTGGWEQYRSLEPIWADTPPGLPSSTSFVIHARSAFGEGTLDVENNMPFVSGGIAFAFNGELRGVRIGTRGRTGAVKLFHLFNRFRERADGDGLAALQKLDELATRRSEWVRALNLVVADGRTLWVNARYAEDPDYFTLYRARTAIDGVAAVAVSSEPLVVPGIDLVWHAIPNGTTLNLEDEV